MLIYQRNRRIYLSVVSLFLVVLIIYFLVVDYPIKKMFILVFIYIMIFLLPCYANIGRYKIYQNKILIFKGLFFSKEKSLEVNKIKRAKIMISVRFGSSVTLYVKEIKKGVSLPIGKHYTDIVIILKWLIDNHISMNFNAPQEDKSMYKKKLIEAGIQEHYLTFLDESNRY